MKNGTSANRGALPCHRLSEAADYSRVLVPLPPEEALWVAWMVDAGLVVSGRAATGEGLRIIRFGAAHDKHPLLRADAIEFREGPRPLDASSLKLAHTRDELQRDQLVFEVFGPGQSPLGRLGLVLGTAALYAAVSGFPAPEATVAADAYGGWRLP